MVGKVDLLWVLCGWVSGPLSLFLISSDRRSQKDMGSFSLIFMGVLQIEESKAIDTNGAVVNGEFEEFLGLDSWCKRCCRQ